MKKDLSLENFKKYIPLFILTIAIIIFVKNCHINECEYVDGIQVYSDVLISADDYNYNYCSLLESSLKKKDYESLVLFSLLEFQGGVISAHSDIIIQIIQKLGRKHYIKALKSQNLSKLQKNIIIGNLGMGVEFDYRVKEEYLKEIYKYLED